ncbi:hypothetical protein NP493_322g02056 [Ridgeia piscesae]|uniref:Telomere-associated protein Rif1 N-terminal domain-containing protein n=1 Tax=Ridgeia piscesae TaxID=27915 RepID=A0AAD9L699_RIDPI|nr:hypothetical protein NP493_322g02056 [Ridgeia piscesae]
MVAVEMGLTAMMQHQAEFSKNLEEDLKTLLIGELHKLMLAGEESYALKVWGVYIKLLGKTLHRSVLINPLLRVPQQGFRHPSSAVKCAAFGAWKTLIDNFALSPDVIADHSRVKLIMQVFARLNAKDESLAMAKLDAWWLFLSRLGTKLPLYFEQVCILLITWQ